MNFIIGPVTIDCSFPYDNVITTNGTIISSPNYPSSYEPNKDCEATIRFKNKILIKFLDFDLEGAQGISRCWDYLTIYDGPNKNYRQIGPRLCGRTIPKEVESTGSTMRILFHTDHRLQYNGFQIQILEFGKYFKNKARLAMLTFIEY